MTQLSRLQRALLEQMLLDPIDAAFLLHYANAEKSSGERLELVQLVVTALRPLLERGYVAPLHFYGSAISPFLTPATTHDDVITVLTGVLTRYGQPGYASEDDDLWFEITDEGASLLETDVTDCIPEVLDVRSPRQSP